VVGAFGVIYNDAANFVKSEGPGMEEAARDFLDAVH